MKQEIQNKINTLKAQINELEAELKKPEKWQPKGGGWYIRADGYVQQGCTDKQFSEFGTERDNQQIAETASKAIRAFTRLLAYRDEFFPYWAIHTGDLYYVVRKNNDTQFDYVSAFHFSNHFDGRVLFSRSVVLELVRKLNSGEVEL